MRMSAKFVACAFAFISCNSAFAATVSPERGKVLLNRGDGYKPVTEPMQATAGDQVMALPGGSGRIIFHDGCTLKVVPGKVLTVSAQSPCKRSARHVESQGTLPPGQGQGPPNDDSYVIPSLLAAGVPIGIMVLRDKDKAASP